jgi:hypothetical protein
VRRTTSVSRSFFESKSKIPPQLGGSACDVVEPLGDEVDVFGFHGDPEILMKRGLTLG